jgi:type VI secretion system ImpM family protein
MSEQYLPLGCFGKLPCYGDFLEGNLLSPTSRALKEWVLEGREAVGLGSQVVETARPKETARRRFLCGLPGSVELVAGVIRPSTDQGGRRSFPFMVFAQFPRRQYGKHYWLLPLALSPAWDALDDAWDSLANVATKAAFQEVVASTLIPPPAPVGEVRSTYEGLQQETAEKPFAREDSSLDALLRNLPDVFRELRKGSNGEGLRLELPVSADPAGACFEASMWIDLLNRQFMWRRFEPGVFLTEGSAEKNAHALFVFGILQARDYPMLLGCEGAEATVARPARSPQQPGSHVESRDARMTYADILAHRFPSGANRQQAGAGQETGAAGGADNARGAEGRADD